MLTDDVIEVLEGDHLNLVSLFGRVSSPDEDRPKVLSELLKSLAAHVGVEQQFLVSVVKEHLPDGDAVSEQLSDDHHRVEKILTLVERRKANSPDLPDFVNDLLDITKAHIETADSVILPGLKEHLSTAQLSQLGTDMLSDERHRLSHSHPLVPDDGPLAGIAGKAAEMVDRIRDRSTDIGRADS